MAMQDYEWRPRLPSHSINTLLERKNDSPRIITLIVSFELK